MTIAHGSPPNSKHHPSFEAVEAGRIWRFRIVMIGFALPLIGVIAFLLLNALPQLGTLFGFEPNRIYFPADLNGRAFLVLLLFGIISTWPFWVIGWVAKRRIVRMWPNVRAARPAIIGGVLGLAIVHGYLYFGSGSLMAIDDQKAGQTAGFMIAALIFGMGWMLGLPGWFGGLFLSRMSNH